MLPRPSSPPSAITERVRRTVSRSMGPHPAEVGRAISADREGARITEEQCVPAAV